MPPFNLHYDFVCPIFLHPSPRPSLRFYFEWVGYPRARARAPPLITRILIKSPRDTAARYGGATRIRRIPAGVARFFSITEPFSFFFFFFIKWLIRVEEETLISRKHRIRANSRLFRRNRCTVEVTSTPFSINFQSQTARALGRVWPRVKVLKRFEFYGATGEGEREGGREGLDSQSFMKRRQSDRILFTRAVSSFSLRPFIASPPIVSPP